MAQNGEDSEFPVLITARDPQAMRDQHPLLKLDLVLSFLYVSKALFYLVLDCVVSPSTTQMPKGNG